MTGTPAEVPVAETPVIVSEQYFKETARELTAKIRGSLETWWNSLETLANLVRQAYDHQAWVALGYESWSAYCNAELDAGRARLSRELRQQLIAELAGGDTQMSTRAIAAVVGVSPQTVVNDRAQLSSSGHLPEPEMVEAESVEEAVPQEVVGIDGKTYSTARHRPKHRRPLTDIYHRHAGELSKIADKLVRLTKDDQFRADAHRLRPRDLQHAAEAIATVLDALAEAGHR